MWITDTNPCEISDFHSGDYVDDSLQDIAPCSLVEADRRECYTYICVLQVFLTVKTHESSP
jgi:hypothetical protein